MVASESVNTEKEDTCTHTVLHGDAEPDVIKSRLLSTKSFQSRVKNNNSVRVGVSVSAKGIKPLSHYALTLF